MSVKCGSGLVVGVPGRVVDGAVVSQLVHVGLVDVPGGGECCCQSPQSRLPR